MTRYRKIGYEDGQVVRGNWTYFSDDDPEMLEAYKDRPSVHGTTGLAGVIDNWCRDRSVFIEIERNGGFRTASIWALPPADLVILSEVEGYRGEAIKIRRPAAAKLAAAGEREEIAEAAVKTAEATLGEAVKARKQAESDQRAAERTARAIDHRREEANRELERRQAAADRAADGPAAGYGLSSEEEHDRALDRGEVPPGAKVMTA